MNTTNSNADLIAQAYLAPDSATVPKYGPLSAKFWCAISAIIVGNVLFTASLLLMHHMHFLAVLVILNVGAVLAWVPGRWIDPRKQAFASSKKEKVVAAIGSFIALIVALAIIIANPTADFRKWYINPFVMPIAWMLISSSCFQVAAAINGLRDAPVEGV